MDTFVKEWFNVKEGIFAITGGAGAGKSTVVNKIILNVGSSIGLVRTDDFFIGDSNYRKELLKNKASIIDDCVDSYNQYNWWNWDIIAKKIEEKKQTSNIIIVEGAILGPLISYFDKIYYINIPSNVRFTRLLDRDKHKRTFYEILIRFMITEYSEQLYLKNTILKLSNVVVVDEDGFPERKEDIPLLNTLYIPMRVTI